MTVELLDGAGAVVAQTATAADGSYLFSGLDEGGGYTVQLASPAAAGVAIGPASQAVTLADGDGAGQFGVDFSYAAMPAVSPLPPLSRPSFVVSWTSGLPDGQSLSVDILVSRDGGPLTPWLNQASQTSAVFQGELGHTYGFAAVPSGAPHNAQSPPAPQATTRAIIRDANGELVVAVYQSLFDRLVDDAGLAWWTRLLDSGTERSDMVDGLDHSGEYFGRVIAAAYQRLLGRAPDRAGSQYWAENMQAGMTDEQLAASLAGSTECLQSAGGDDEAWVGAMYQYVLGRGADAAGEAFWTAQLQSGASRSQIAEQLFGGDERQRQQISDDFILFFRRPADPQGLDYWIGQLAQGQTDESVVTGLLGSDEYFAQFAD
jgi:hypothetical protein